MELLLKDLTLISKTKLKALIEAAGDKVVLYNTDLTEATKLAEYAYEAGCQHNELSLCFDNPKGRFLNSEINF